MNRSFSPPPPPPADTSSSTPAFFAEDDDSNDSNDEYSHDTTEAVDNHHSKNLDDRHRMSHESQSSVSTTSLILERISDRAEHPSASKLQAQAGDLGDMHSKKSSQSRDHMSDFDDEDPLKDDSADYDLETGPFLGGNNRGDDGQANGSSRHAVAGDKSKYTKMDAGLRRIVIIVAVVVAALWLGGLAVYVTQRSYLHGSSFEHDPQATKSHGSLRKITRFQLSEGFFSPQRASIQWVAGPSGEDGLLLETSRDDQKSFLTAADVRSISKTPAKRSDPSIASRILVKKAFIEYGGTRYVIGTAAPSLDMAKVLLSVNSKSNWRHSKVASYFILDVASQTAEPLVPGEPDARIQLAQWSPTSDAVSFTRDNNLYLRAVPADASLLATTPVKQITTDGGPELFYGIPDWVYEEEVFGGASATWWSPDGKHLAFLRTNETGVPEYPVQYFIERPSGTDPVPGEENYPEVRQIKYPKAGAHNPVVDLQFCDISSGEVFTVPVSGDFTDENRLITTVLWAGPQKVLVKETNRISDVMRVVVVDVGARSGQAVRTVNVGKIDGGWFEISTTTKYVPADAARGRPDDGYIDTIVHNDGDHLAYFTPPENPEPIMLTEGISGNDPRGWEVVDAPSGVDLERNLVYFVATIAGPSQRHVYSVNLLDGSGLKPLINETAEQEEGFYSASFSKGAGFVLLEYRGPGIPWQKVLSTPALAAAGASSEFQLTLEDNTQLAERVRKHALPLNVYGTLDVDTGSGETVKLNYLERRPPHFNPNKKYPVLFQQYSGPGSQEVKKEFKVDFQSYVAAALGYVVVTVDPRGTGYMGRRHRVNVRGQLGVNEAHDHIAAAAHWSSLSYVDPERLAIWGWSYGGFTTLKTLEQDAGRHYKYGIAVAPVTDWRFYDSIYTERYMDTPQNNAAGYDTSTIQNATALADNVRFLLMHGIADDNVHMQNSLALLDRLDLAGVSNYDVHVFPDSDHSIFFHNGHEIVYDKLENWLINAFNGEWLKINKAVPIDKR
ncbi:dipeptidyl aminopeptidase b [Ophiostoma piceae UAMH 11346]|uniref:Probable dipeptidyl-aminopeptidase B n=1 Tax=Ophiostoma piceae (strain UAMH 11346) TaxID=1262450 RepID=S3BYM3_OPHP1|nr:dipeptidyl aminopeptidase b [Ophiostoma piceae UAMH 11346]